MMRYLQKIKDLVSVFNKFEIQQIPKLENFRADLLPKLATSTPLELPKKAFCEVISQSSIEEQTTIMQIDEEPS